MITRYSDREIELHLTEELFPIADVQTARSARNLENIIDYRVEKEHKRVCTSGKILVCIS